MKCNVILFPDFETLDVFGPVEVFGKLDRLYEIEFYSEKGGLIRSSQNVQIMTLPFSDLKEPGILMIPGGFGTRKEVDNQALILSLTKMSTGAIFVLTICTGAALLAKTGLIKNKNATTNKMAFDWVIEQDREVKWVRKARWIHDGKFYSSSGVSAGIDMALGFVSEQHGIDVAERIAKGIEYIWNRDRDEDPFC